MKLEIKSRFNESCFWELLKLNQNKNYARSGLYISFFGHRFDSGHLHQTELFSKWLLLLATKAGVFSGSNPVFPGFLVFSLTLIKLALKTVFFESSNLFSRLRRFRADLSTKTQDCGHYIFQE